ncbi:regulator of G protein signaling [Xylona heveae TC161]|uniref:Regulator of G protein signaling n=1 Tax=Xylona heveae (strain CBS 132557 / TC161) TaxID=1328760 RepID=A0A165J5P0_XYLHT|nr:regulator of G protein signaling [Xylona heveae TC161]KZF25764.1 regulator of G protein signaling [Xylona heveae TC161]
MFSSRRSRPPSPRSTIIVSGDSTPILSSALSDCDADDEATMSAAEEFLASRPPSMSAPQGPYCPRVPTLADVLNNSAPPPFTLTAFMAYLSQNHCLENLEFTMDASRYQKQYEEMIGPATEASSPTSSDTEYVRMLWRRLLHAYIVPNGPREVNLPGDVRDDLLALPDDEDPPSPEMLDPAVKIVYQLMEESVLVPFLHSVSNAGGAPSMGIIDTMDERVSHRRHSRDDRRTGQTQPTTATEQHSSSSYGSANLAHLGRLSTSNLGSTLRASRLSPHRSHSSNTSGDTLTTDDSQSSSNPVGEPMTPPTTPPTSDAGGLSPKLRHDNTWKKMTTKLSFKKKKNNSGSLSRHTTDSISEH